MPPSMLYSPRSVLARVGPVLAAGALVLSVFGLAGRAAASDSYTWGYDAFSRSRVSVVPVPYNVLPGVAQRVGPWVVAVPFGYMSQSTPVVVGSRIFFFAFKCAQPAADGGCAWSTQAALFESDFGASGVPGPAQEVASFSASSNENYASPSDPSVSPDGKWLAIAVGRELYWWPISGSGLGFENLGFISPNIFKVPYFVSSAPLFVPDPQPGSGGWAVCSGDSVGYFNCYSVEGFYSFRSTLYKPYFTGSTSVPVESSAVYVPGGVAGRAGDTVCFGVGAWRPWVECLDPFGDPQSGRDAVRLPRLGGAFDGGFFRPLPIVSALAYGGRDLWVTDQDGGLYAISIRTGAPVGSDLSHDAGSLSISPPAVDAKGGLVATVKDGYQLFCFTSAVQPSDGSDFCMPRGMYAGQLTAATIVPDVVPGCDDVWEGTNAGTLFEAQECQDRFKLAAKAPPTDWGLSHDFSALVVGVGPDSRYVLAWSDGATLLNGATVIDPPGMAVDPSRAYPGVEVWALKTPVEAWSLEQPVTAGGTMCLVAATYPGAAAGVRFMVNGQFYAAQRVESVAGADITPGVGPAVRPIAGCPVAVPSGLGRGPWDPWSALQAEWQQPSGAPLSYAAGNVSPFGWGGAGSLVGTWTWPADVWVARVPAPAGPGSGLLRVAAYVVEPGGLSYGPFTFGVGVACPAGETAAGGGVACRAPMYGVSWFSPNGTPVSGGPGRVMLYAMVPAWVGTVTAISPAGVPYPLSDLGAGVFGGIVTGQGSGPLYTYQETFICQSSDSPMQAGAQYLLANALQGIECSQITSSSVAETNAMGWAPLQISAPSPGWDGQPYRLWAAWVPAPASPSALAWTVTGTGPYGTVRLQPLEVGVCPDGEVLRSGACVTPPPPPPCPQGQWRNLNTGACEPAPVEPCPYGKFYVNGQCVAPPTEHVIGIPGCGTLGPKCQPWELNGTASYYCQIGKPFCKYGPPGEYPPPPPTTLEAAEFLANNPWCAVAASNGILPNGHGYGWHCVIYKQGTY